MFIFSNVLLPLVLINEQMTRGTAKTLAYFQNTRGIFLFIIEYINYRPV